MAFSGDYPVTFSQGRRGEVFVSQGHHKRPQVYSPSSKVWRDAGVDAPTAKPSIQVTGPAKYYVARVDIEDGGTGYIAPPRVEFSPAGAKAIAFVVAGSVSEIQMTDHGSHYDGIPCVSLVSDASDPAQGSNATFEVEYEPGGSFASGDPKTGIVYWEVVQAADTTVNGEDWVKTGLTTITQDGYTVYVGAGAGGSGTGAKVRLNMIGMSKPGSDLYKCSTPVSNSVPAIEVEAFGSGYAATDFVELVVNRAGTSGTNACPMIIRGYPLGHPRCPPEAALADYNPSHSKTIKSVKVKNGGSGYNWSTDLNVLVGSTQHTLRLGTDCTGAVTGVEDLGGGLYGSACIMDPTIGSLSNRKATAHAVVRAILRGKYQCYYRYVDESLPESEGGPRYSSLSPVNEVDAGNGAARMLWNVPKPKDGFAVELWRSTSNQATTLFRVARLFGKNPIGTTVDEYSDWDLTNPDREGFTAMPILLPNGEINANRFSPPPDNFAVAVYFQDRLWMGVDTDGIETRTLRFSEVDEAESMPDVNELIIQSNVRSTDYLTALIPFAGALICCQSRHTHRMTYVAQPLIDAAFYLLAYRGCLNQRCWDIYDGLLYCMDEQGVYSMDAQGSVKNLTMGLDDYWTDRIDFRLSKWFLVRADRQLNVLRVNVAVKGDGSTRFPTRQLVYSFEYQSWWEERYPQELTAASECQTEDGRSMLVYGTSSGSCYRLGSGLTDVAVGAVRSVEILDPGHGYRVPPKVTIPGPGSGAEFEVGLDSDGAITGISVKCTGTGYKSGALVIEPPPNGRPAAARFEAIDGDIPVHYFFRSGAFEFVSDSQDRRAGEAQTRHCSVTYQPTNGSSLLFLQTYYNNARYPRSNVVRRDRGAGFVHSERVPAAILDMKATSVQEAESHGVARALFNGRLLDDITGADRHVAISLSGKQNASGPVSIHVVDIYGTVEGKE